MVKKEYTDLLAMGIGAGLKGTASGLIRNVVPNLSDNVGGLIAGGALYYFAKRRMPVVGKIGAGILIASIGGFVEGLVGGMNLTGGTQTTVVQREPTIEDYARM